MCSKKLKELDWYLRDFSVSSCENGISDSIPNLIPFCGGSGSRIFERELMWKWNWNRISDSISIPILWKQHFRIMVITSYKHLDCFWILLTNFEGNQNQNRNRITDSIFTWANCMMDSSIPKVRSRVPKWPRWNLRDLKRSWGTSWSLRDLKEVYGSLRDFWWTLVGSIGPQGVLRYFQGTLRDLKMSWGSSRGFERSQVFLRDLKGF